MNTRGLNRRIFPPLLAVRVIAIRRQPKRREDSAWQSAGNLSEKDQEVKGGKATHMSLLLASITGDDFLSHGLLRRGRRIVPGRVRICAGVICKTVPASLVSEYTEPLE